MSKNLSKERKKVLVTGGSGFIGKAGAENWTSLCANVSAIYAACFIFQLITMLKIGKPQLALVLGEVVG